MKITGSVTNAVNVPPAAAGPMCTPDQPDGPVQAPAQPQTPPPATDGFDATQPKGHAHRKHHGGHDDYHGPGHSHGKDKAKAHGADKAAPAAPPTLDDLKNQLLNDPNFKKLSPEAQQVTREAIRHMQDPKELEAMGKQMASPWVQGLKPEEQARVMKSFALENMTGLEKGAWMRQNILDNIR